VNLCGGDDFCVFSTSMRAKPSGTTVLKASRRIVYDGSSRALSARAPPA
jgi:hypothetical protein